MTLRLARRALVPALALAACSGGETPADRGGFPCVHDLGTAVTDCGPAVAVQATNKPVLSDPAELVIRGAEASRDGPRLLVEVELAGGFHNEIDQNIYLLIGAQGSLPTRYALSADGEYASSTGYRVRDAAAIPHAQDIRVGVMAPRPSGYSPQVYLGDPRFADAVGPDSGVSVLPAGKRLIIGVPLDPYYAKRGQPVPATVSVTVATARDYVGFVDVRTIEGVGPSGAAVTAGPEVEPPALYPVLDLDSHVLHAARIEGTDRGVDIVFHTKAKVTDWAQSNLHAFFFPIEPYPASFVLLDPSRTQRLPSKWSYYCAVYSPSRVFCKASGGADFTFDNGYSDRAALAAPDGVTFRSDGERHVLSLTYHVLRAARAGRPTFALVLALGRDGFAPTTWFGLPPSPAPATTGAASSIGP